ncbi:CPBP family intramembrane glutamic endopeptidase [Paractinoplanes lichenicola]|uniref:CPBP family intramembrane metalloprotease n=1 Tax=Paractinoplanes lichenicola TaxID=2802976 RepID=A0ABS1VQ61_9ACTN|nr:type II CAAX endopeptidase family protein [Actinoplanes lichenicola]MBL7255897.1 CPBP family intramembrane metalloprotease [Actinoplanes lichenicola]
MNLAWVRRALGPSLIDRVERDHQQTDQQFRRRRIVVAFTLVAGAVLLGISLSVRPGDDLFYLLTVLVAATWITGALLSGPLHLGRIAFRDKLRRPIVTPIVTGLVIGAIFVTGSLIVRELPALRELVNSVLAHARYGAIVPIVAITLLNGVAEEVFFRGALFAAIGRRHAVLLSTVIYAAATVATGNLMLVFAAFLLGLVLGLQRRASGGILAPILTHITWSTTMLFALPALIHQ